MLKTVILIAILAFGIKYIKDFDLDFFQETQENSLVYDKEFLTKSRTDGKLYLAILGSICEFNF